MVRSCLDSQWTKVRALLQGKNPPLDGPASVQGQMKISNKFLKKKSPKKKEAMKKAKKRKMADDDDEIEEITLDDEDSVGFVSQTELESRTAANINKKANKFING